MMDKFENHHQMMLQIYVLVDLEGIVHVFYVSVHFDEIHIESIHLLNR